jgi:AraC-like DNA-binding protein
MDGTGNQSDWGLHVDWVLRYLLEKGVSHTEISAVLSRKIDRSPDSLFLPIDDYLLLFAWAADRLSAPHLGLDIAHELQPHELGIYGYLIKNSSTVGDLCEMAERYQPIFMRGMGYTILTGAQQFEVRWEIYRPDSEGVRQDNEFSLAAFLRVLRLKLGDTLTPQRVNFKHCRAAPLEYYRQAFGSDVYFEQAQNSLVFNPDLLRMPLSDSDPRLLAILKEQADALMEQWESKRSLVGQARFLIATSLESEDESKEGGMEMLANHLHTTSRTLNRRFTKEGTSYQKLREEVIERTAKRALAESDASITIIAGKLGYSESSAFVRAFKRLTGTTPTTYRSQARQSVV